MEKFVIADFSGLEKWKSYMKQESVKDGSTERMKQENEQYCITFIFRQ